MILNSVVYFWLVLVTLVFSKIDKKKFETRQFHYNTIYMKIRKFSYTYLDM